MQVQLSTDNHIQGDARLASYVEGLVTNALGRFGNRITRVVVSLSDSNSNKKSGSNDKQCVMEARLGGLDPITVTSAEESVELALDTAINRLEKTLNRIVGKLSDAKGRTSASGQ